MAEPERKPKQPGNPPCVLDTEPSGATIVTLRRDRTLEGIVGIGVAERDPDAKPPVLEGALGTTPITMLTHDWYLFGTAVFEARLDGYKPQTVSPLTGGRCSPIFRLEKP